MEIATHSIQESCQFFDPLNQDHCMVGLNQYMHIRTEYLDIYNNTDILVHNNSNEQLK